MKSGTLSFFNLLEIGASLEMVLPFEGRKKEKLLAESSTREREREKEEGREGVA